MVIGWSELAPKVENDEKIDGVVKTILVDERLETTNQNSKITKVVTHTLLLLCLVEF